MLRRAATRATQLARRAARRPVSGVRRMATEAAESQHRVPTAEELENIAEFEKLIDRRLADGLRDIHATIKHLEVSVDASLSKHTVKIIGMIAGVGGGGLTLAWRGGLFERTARYHQQERQQTPQIIIIPESAIRRVATGEGAARVEHAPPRPT